MSHARKLEECRDILHEITCDIEGRYPIGLVRVGRLIEELLEELDQQWDLDDVATLPLCFLDDDYPAA